MSQSHIVVEPPFYPNLPDESHCLEACVKMIVEAIPPFTKMDYQEINELTGKTHLTVKYSWPLKLYLELNRIGYEVSVIESFDYESFVDDPESYLINNYGDEVGKDQIENSDLANETFYAKKLIESKTVKLINKTPEFQDIFDTLSSGFLVICNVNQKILQGDDGYIGHSIVIYGFGNNVLYVHNPGPPYRAKQTLALALFDKAWSYPSNNSRNILAVRSSV